MYQRKIIAMGLVIVMVLVALVTFTQPARASHGAVVPNGPWLDRIVWTQNADQSQALTDIVEGRTDAFIFSVGSATDKARAKASFEVTPIETYGSVNTFEINPMVQQAGFSMNPFALQKVREAMHYLVDRDLLIREAQGGLAIPYVIPFHPKSADYGRVIDIAAQIEDKYRPNPGLAKQMITDAMTAAGATLVNGKWRDSQNRLVEVIVWSRVEDERLLFGQYLSTLLDGVGFTARFTPVDRTYITRVYGGPADLGLWHVYTGGFGFTAQVFLDDTQMYSFHGCVDEPWCDPQSPGGTPNPGGYVPPAALVNGALKVFEGNYSTLDERLQILREIVPISVTENREMWLTAEAAVYPTSARMSIGYDLFGATQSEIAVRTARVKSATCAYEVGGAPCVGRWVNFLAGQAAWNPWLAGTNTLYDGVVQDGFIDFGVTFHPHKGNFIPFRTPFEVTTTGPTGTPLGVPATALKYNTATNTWVAVGAGVSAVSKVVFTPTFGAWHHGPAMNMEDIKDDIAFFYRRGFGDISLVLPNALSTGDKTFASRYKGFEFTGTTFTVYIDFFNFDNTQIAVNSAFWPTVPWEVRLTAAKTLLESETANNERDAQSTGRVWLDLTKGASLPFLTADMGTLAGLNGVPPGSSVSAAEATERWTALQTWVTARSHFWTSNGPFFLSTLDPGTFQFTLDAHRGYPLKADYYDPYLVPRVPDIAFPSAPSVVFSGTPGVFDFTSTVAGSPYDSITTKWFLKNLATGAILANGTSTQLGAGAYRIELSSQLTEQLLFGNFQLLVVISSADASPPAIVKPTFLILPSVAYFDGLVSATESALQADIDALETQQGRLESAIAAANAASQGLTVLITVLTAVAIVGILISVVTLVRVMRKPKPPMKTMGEGERPPEEL